MGELDREVVTRYAHVHARPDVIRYIVVNAVATQRRVRHLSVDEFVQAGFMALWGTCSAVDPRRDEAAFMRCLNTALRWSYAKVIRGDRRQRKFEEPWDEALNERPDGCSTPEAFAIARDLARKLEGAVVDADDPYLQEVFEARVGPLLGRRYAEPTCSTKMVRTRTQRLAALLFSLTQQQ